MIVISHAKLQINVWMFVSGRKWYSGIKDGPFPSPAVLWVVSTLIEKKKKNELKNLSSKSLFLQNIFYHGEKESYWKKRKTSSRYTHTLTCFLIGEGRELLEKTRSGMMVSEECYSKPRGVARSSWRRRIKQADL